MFNSKKKQQKLFERVHMIKPTSKAALKQQCLYLCNLKVDEAEKMYDFLVKDMKELPDVEPEQKSFIQNLGDSANGILGWFRENQDMLSQAVDLVKSIVTRGKGTPPNVTPLPPINGE